MEIRLSDLLGPGPKRRVDTGEAALEVEARYWRPKPMEEIVGVPLAPSDGGGTL